MVSVVELVGLIGIEVIEIEEYLGPKLDVVNPMLELEVMPFG